MRPEEISRWHTDETEIRDAHWHPAAGDVVLDVGCHVGSYTLPALIAGAFVHAVDPDTGRLGIVQGLADERQLGGQLRTWPYALAGPDGFPGDFTEHVLHSGLYPDMMPVDGSPCMTMDALAIQAGLEKLDWVKIDVEGAELLVLQGGEETLRRFHPRMLIESHDNIYTYVGDTQVGPKCRTLLEGMGYQVTVAHYPVQPQRDFMICR